jgi:ubiquinone biosynthesis protein UbiJ
MRPLRFDPAAIPSTLINGALEREAWAQSCLAAHAGRAFAVVVGPLAATMRIDATGKVAPAPEAKDAADLRLVVSPMGLPALLANPRRWDEFVVADGDTALAVTLKGLAETLPWFVERVFADALGPVVGQRIADSGRHLLAFPEYAAARFGESISSYVRDESELAVRRADAQSFADDVAATAARVDTLAERVDALVARVESASPTGRAA